MKRTFDSVMVVEGEAGGLALASATPLSFWGGVNPQSGKVIDVHHDLCGQCISGLVLCIPYERGSCSGSGIMLEMIRLRTAPAAILCLEAEPVLSLGSVIGGKLYGRGVAIHTVSREALDFVCTGAAVAVRHGGGVDVEIAP